jgi:hypothetical protein
VVHPQIVAAEQAVRYKPASASPLIVQAFIEHPATNCVGVEPFRGTDNLVIDKYLGKEWHGLIERICKNSYRIGMKRRSDLFHWLIS